MFIGERAELTENGFLHFRRRFIENSWDFFNLVSHTFSSWIKVRIRPNGEKDVTFHEIPIFENSLYMSIWNENSNTTVKPDF